MHYTYILESHLDGSFYVGSSENPHRRESQHNDGWSRSTKAKRPWKLVYAEAFATKSEAIRRERELKRWKSHRALKALIKRAGGRPDSL